MNDKKDVNVRKHPVINFQIGLIASLLFTYVMFEVYTTPVVSNDANVATKLEPETVVWDGAFEVYQEPKPVAVVQKTQVRVPDPEDFEVVKDDTVINEMKDEFINETPVEEVAVPTNAIIEVPEDDEPVDVPFSVVEDVPVFPGCEKLKTKREKAACFNEKIQKIIRRKFNTDLGSEYGLSGVQRIYTMFDVSRDGTIQNVQVRAPHPRLEKEAKRVIGLFPQMTPGMQRKKPVTVKYQLPIVFQVQD